MELAIRKKLGKVHCRVFFFDSDATFGVDNYSFCKAPYYRFIFASCPIKKLWNIKDALDYYAMLRCFAMFQAFLFALATPPINLKIKRIEQQTESEIFLSRAIVLRRNGIFMFSFISTAPRIVLFWLLIESLLSPRDIKNSFWFLFLPELSSLYLKRH